jgi:hypothetical protein
MATPVVCPCGRPVIARGLCPTCYQRERRREQGARPALVLGDSELLRVKVPGELLEKVRRAADAAGLSIAAWVRRVIEGATT